ncbi:MAG: cytochrome c [Candidatus Latescibacteria bacterium]|nr:cytochrome c [Candidatus Latescibacterota bacterium]
MSFSRSIKILIASAAGLAFTHDVPTVLAQTVTYSRHVAPIFQEKCESCHREGAMGPMSLVGYDEVRPWARAINRVVLSGEMPPWHIDKSVGIQDFSNDRSMTDTQIETVLRWVAEGAPRGNPEDMPAPRTWSKGDVWLFAESLGPPDLVITSPVYTMPTSGADVWYRPITETGITRERWVRAIEIRPSTRSGRRITHHAIAKLQQDEATPTQRTNSIEGVDAGLFMEWAVGKQGEMMRADTGKLMRPDSQILWDIHHHAVGEEIETAIELAIYFYPDGVVPRFRQHLGLFNVISGDPRNLDIPPRTITRNQGHHVMQRAGRIENFQPHMHLRGKAMSMEAILPDGTVRLLSHVNNFQFNWHNNYIYADHVAPLLPAGTTLRFTAWHDNTVANRDNPDADQWVGWGDRTIDEMAHAWVNITYMKDEDYQAAIAERSRGRSLETLQE